MERLNGVGIGEGHLDPATALQRVQGRISARANWGSYHGTTSPRPPISGQGFEAMIARAAAEADLDPALVRAVVAVESGFEPNAVSPAGAKGLMQLMDGTARQLGVADPFDPEQNLRGGTTFLRYLLDRYGDERLALAAYNAGPGAVDRYGGIPPYAETQRYVREVLAERARSDSWRA